MAYLIAAFAILAQTIISLAHWFLYKTLVRSFNLYDPAVTAVLRWSLLLLSLLFVPASALSFRYYNALTKMLYTLAAGWLGLFFFLFLAAVLMRLGALFPVNHGLLAWILLTLAIGAGIYGIINANNPRITTLSVHLPDLPAAWQGKTAVWVSDIHLGQIRNSGFARKVADKISVLRPDIVFIGGDLFDGTTLGTEEAIRPFAELKPPQGIYFITGNHEEFGDSPKHLNTIKNAGIKILGNEVVDLDGLQVVGVDYHDSANLQTYRLVMKSIKLDPNKPSILLKHEPNNLAVAEQAGIDFQISGHTHQAQVWPLNYIAKAYYKGFDTGSKYFGPMRVYTSSGVGTWGPPIRFLTKPEIVQIRLE